MQTNKDEAGNGRKRKERRGIDRTERCGTGRDSEGKGTEGEERKGTGRRERCGETGNG